MGTYPSTDGWLLTAIEEVRAVLVQCGQRRFLSSGGRILANRVAAT